MGFPKEDQISKALKKMSKKNEHSYVSDNNSLADTIKGGLCEILIHYKRINRLKNKELAMMANYQEARISDILHYRVSKISIEKIMSVLQNIGEHDQNLKEFISSKVEMFSELDFDDSFKKSA